MQNLHLAALEVLRRTRIRFHYPEALAILKEMENGTTPVYLGDVN